MEQLNVTWICTRCEALNSGSNISCESCSTPRIERFWSCPVCETSNLEHTNECEVCGESKDEAFFQVFEAPGRFLPEVEPASSTALIEITGQEWSAPGYLPERDLSTLPKKGRFLGRVRKSIRAGIRKIDNRFARLIVWLCFLPFLIATGAVSLAFSIVRGVLKGLYIPARPFSKLIPPLHRSMEKWTGRAFDDPRYLPAFSERSSVFQAGHSAPIVGLNFNGVGNELFSVDALGMVFKWDVATGRKVEEKMVFRPRPNKAQIGTKRAYAIDGHKLRVLSNKNTVLWTLDLKNPVEDASPFRLSGGKNRWLAVGHSNGPVFLYDLKQRKPRKLNDQSFALAKTVEFFPGEQKILAGNVIGSLKVWDLVRFRVEWEDIRHGFALTCGAVSGNKTWFAAGYSDGLVRVFGAKSFQEYFRFNIEAPLEHKGATISAQKMVLTPGKSALVIVADTIGRVLVYQSIYPQGSCELIDEISTGDTEVREMIISRQGKWLAVGTASGRVSMYYLGKYS